MIKAYTKAVGQLQELFQELADEGKISQDQAGRFNESQKVLINFHSWIKRQLDGNINVELPWDAPEFVSAWKLWRDYKKQQYEFTYKPIGEQGALKDLADLSGGDMNVAIEIIHQSIKKGWMGFYVLKGKKESTKKIVDNRSGDYKQQLINRLNGG